MEAKNILFTHIYSVAESTSTKAKEKKETSKDLLKIWHSRF